MKDKWTYMHKKNYQKKSQVEAEYWAIRKGPYVAPTYTAATEDTKDEIRKSMMQGRGSNGELRVIIMWMGK